MKTNFNKPKKENFALQLLMRVCLILFIHFVAVLIGGLLIGSNKIIRIIMGVLLFIMIYAFLFFMARGDGDKDYVILTSNKRKYYNSIPLNHFLRQFSYAKGFLVALVALAPVIIIHVITLIGRFTALKIIMAFFFTGYTLFATGTNIYDTAIALTGANYTAYAIIYTMAIVLSIVVYGLAYIIGGYRRILFHNNVGKEKNQKKRDW